MEFFFYTETAASILFYAIAFGVVVLTIVGAISAWRSM